jgi:hypothetical protein
LRDAASDEKAAERYVMTRLESRREELAILRGMWRKVPKDLRSERAREAMFAKGAENEDIRSDLEKAGVPKRTDYKSAIPDIRRAMGSILKSGRPVSINGEVVTAIHKAVDEVRGMVPAGAKVYALARVEPTEEPGTVIAVFEDQDGNEYPLTESWNYLSGIRAAYFEGNIFFVRLSPRALRDVGQFNGGIAAELGHEVAHALRWSGRLGGDTWARLLDHARSLRLLDGEFGTYLKIVGDPSADKVADVTTREIYERLYNTRENRAELMDQEEVAHLVEWYMRGELSRQQVEPVIDILDDIIAGRIQSESREFAFARKMAFAAADQGRAQRRELDRLGFYSKALEAAKDLRQAKGTPEQMLKMVMDAAGAGAKNEVAATKLSISLRARSASPRTRSSTSSARTGCRLRKLSMTTSRRRGGTLSTRLANCCSLLETRPTPSATSQGILTATCSAWSRKLRAPSIRLRRWRLTTQRTARRLCICRRPCRSTCQTPLATGAIQVAATRCATPSLIGKTSFSAIGKSQTSSGT